MVEYFSEQGGRLSEKERLNRYETAKAYIVAHPTSAVPFLGDQFDNPAFIAKEVAYDLLISVGRKAIELIKAKLEERKELNQIWLISVLHLHHDFSQTRIFWKLLSKSSSPYVRHVTSLAIAFQGLARQACRQELMETLIDSLLSEERIENSAFSVADSALSCLTLITGKHFTKTDQIEFYNFNPYVFEPPVHPFPYTSGRITTLPVSERRIIASLVADWWRDNHDTFQFKEVTGCFDY